MTLHVKLPWPKPVLSPNSGAHWRPLSNAKRVYRKAAFALALEAGASAFRSGRDPKCGVIVRFKFCPPNRIRRDKDNMIGSLKSGQDGIADAIHVDDSLWQVTHEIGEPVKGGCVLVEIEAGAA